MSIKGKANIVGIFEHPTRKADDKSLFQLHAECAQGALADAGLGKNDIDGYFCAAGDTPGLGALSMIDYLGLKLRHWDSTDTGGSSYLLQVGHAAEAIAAGKCSIALITLAGRPRTEGQATGTAPRGATVQSAETAFENPYAPATANMYAMCAMRHMHQYGTTSEQLAWVKVAASHHAQYNPHAMLRDVVTVEDVVNSPMIADPLHRLDCCVISDGGGAIIVASPEVAKSLKRPLVRIIGAGEAPKHQMGGTDRPDLFGRGVVGAGSLCRGRGQARRHQICLDLRQLYDHRGDADRGSRLLRERPGRSVRLRRQFDLGHWQTAVQHRWRRVVQQSPVEPRRIDQGGRGGASVAWRGASQGPGPELRSGVGARHRRLARHPPWGGDRYHGKGVTVMQSQERKIQAPVPNLETKTFWDAAAEGKLMVGKCEACGAVHYYPRAFCPVCFSDKTRLQQVSGNGTIYTYSVMRRAPIPYAIAYVTLAEGPTMMTNIVDCDLDQIRIGQAVKLVFKPSDGGPPVPMFTPV